MTLPQTVSQLIITTTGDSTTSTKNDFFVENNAITNYYRLHLSKATTAIAEACL
jgi:hypothetical protein